MSILFVGSPEFVRSPKWVIWKVVIQLLNRRCRGLDRQVHCRS
jgi:hypothetical protein